MPNTKTSALAALTGAAAAGTDVMPVVDVSDTSMAASGTTKKMALDELVAFLRTQGLTPARYNASVAGQGPGFAADTYLTGSDILIPASSLQAKTMYYCMFVVSKTAAGIATPAINLRVGTAGSTADTSRGALSLFPQTAAADEAVFEVWSTFRTVGAGTAATLYTACRLTHRLDITGFANIGSPAVGVASGGFDSTLANLRIGLSVNAGASAAWTVNLVRAQLDNLV